MGRMLVEGCGFSHFGPDKKIAKGTSRKRDWLCRLVDLQFLPDFLLKSHVVMTINRANSEIKIGFI